MTLFYKNDGLTGQEKMMRMLIDSEFKKQQLSGGDTTTLMNMQRAFYTNAEKGVVKKQTQARGRSVGAERYASNKNARMGRSGRMLMKGM